MVLSRDFKEFIELLNAREVKYLIIGGYAVAFHGSPRNTKDIDIWLLIDPENAERVVRALGDFGFASLGLGPADFMEPDTIVQLGFAPNRIDLIMGAPGVDFGACYAARVETTIDGLVIPFIARNDLIENKKATGRLQDLADVEALGG